jgi:beta-lactamase superfamily II metal-dependent hydrolase
VHELDLLPVGAGKQSGDAFALRFTRPDTGAEARVIIDAGYRAEGAAMVAHVRERWGSDRVDLVVSTHPDPDHIGGLPTVLHELEVGTLWIHRLESHRTVRELLGIAAARGTTVVEPWTGQTFGGGALRLLGPDRATYAALQGAPAPTRPGFPWRTLRAVALAIHPRLPFEIPFGPFEGTSPRNDSAMILALELPGFRALLPSDAGVAMVHRALDLAPGPYDLVLVAHHGSTHNASSRLLDRLAPARRGDPAFVSAAKGSPFHPARHVVRAYERRGRRVQVTAGRVLRETGGA